MPWDPDRYQKFRTERAAPFEDLLGLLNIRAGLRVVDLGCGTGELTRQLADILPGSDVVGLDSSPEMLARAAEQARPGLRFEQADIQTAGGEWDVVFSHAALQWVADHAALIPRLYGMLRPGGQLVVQMPSNHGHLTHRLIAEIASETPFREALGGWVRRSPVLGIDQYAELLFAQGAEQIVVFEKVYPHVLADAEALLEWMSGTALMPYAERLGDALYQQFSEVYGARLRSAWPTGPVFFGFRRTLFAATRPG